MALAEKVLDAADERVRRRRPAEEPHSLRAVCAPSLRAAACVSHGAVPSIECTQPPLEARESVWG